MHYPIAIEPGDDQHAFGVVVPDRPGCFSAGDSAGDAMAQARDAILLHLEGRQGEGKAASGQPGPPSPVDLHAAQSGLAGHSGLAAKAGLAAHSGLSAKADFKGWLWAIVAIDPADLSDAVERVNITLPKRVLTAADRYAAARGETRSGFLARAALETMARD